MDNTDFRTIYIEGFPLDATEVSLTKFFTCFGKIKRLDLPKFAQEHPLNKGVSPGRLKTQGYAFIEFSSKLEAQRTCAFLNDINNILDGISSQSTGDAELHREPVGEVDSDNQREKIASSDDKSDKIDSSDSIKAKLLGSEEYRMFKHLRAMPKDTHTKYSRRFEKQRLKSLICAAKLLMVKT